MNLRETGVYAAHDDTVFRVAFHDLGRVVPYEFAGDPHTAGAIATADLDRLEQVTMVATWHEVPVTVSRITASMLAWVTLHDVHAADRLGLYGDPKRGWGAAVPLHQLTELHEIVVDLLSG